jgi:uncharacterized SAM-binding protein YcdF (DUF218 family)
MDSLKSLIAWAISPVVLCLLLQIPGWILCRTRWRRIGIGLIGVGTAVLLIGSLPVVSFHTNRSREAAHPPLQLESALDPSRPVLAVVLGTGFNPDPELPANSRVSGTFLARLTEGVRVIRNHPDARLLVSVANPDASPQTKREFITALAAILAIDPTRIDLITDARSTADEVRSTAKIHRPGEQLVVVTSASHMPRAIKLFTTADLSPTPAPSDFHYPRQGSPDDKPWKQWIPSGEATGSTHQLLYETLAGFARS